MEEKNVLIRVKNADGSDWDKLYPITKEENVIGNDGKSTQERLTEVSEAVAAHEGDSASHVHYAVDTGTANAKVVTLSPTATFYTEGLAVAFKNKVLNSGAVTINVDGLGSKSVLKSNGSAVSAGNLKADSIYTLRYNGMAFILQGEGGEYGTAGAPQVLAGYNIGTENGLVDGTIVNRGAPTFTPTGSSQAIPAGYYSGGNVAAKPAPTYNQDLMYANITVAPFSSQFVPTIGGIVLMVGIGINNTFEYHRSPYVGVYNTDLQINSTHPTNLTLYCNRATSFTLTITDRYGCS